MKIRRNIISLFIYLFSLFIYILTISQTISGGDSGELSTCCYLLSIAHPTGYPLYTLLGKIFTFLPIGSIALRLNFLSCFFSSLTAVVVYQILQIISKRYFKNSNSLIIIFSTFLFTFSTVFWYQALITEVYSLNIFFFSILILILMKWREEKNLKILYFFVFLFGISFSHYFLIITYLPIFIYFIYKENDKSLNKIFLFFLFLLGISIYLYLPLRSLVDYPFSRFNTHNFFYFFDFINAKGFKEISLDLERYREIFPNILLYFLSQFTIFGLIIFLFGIFKLFKTEILLFVFFVSGIIINLIFSLPASFSFDIESFLIPTYFFTTMLIFSGFSFIFKKNFGKIFLSIFIIYFILISFQRFPKIDQSKNEILYNYSKEILKKIPENSILICSNSSTLFSFIFLYLQNVENLRKDVVLFYPMYTRSKRYIEYLKKNYQGIRLNEKIYNLSNLKGKSLKSVLPEEFWKFYYKKHLFMKLGNLLSGGGITEGISNHYRCLYIASEFINLNIERFNIYLLNNEIYETPKLNLFKKYFLIPENYVFKITKKREKKFKEKEIKIDKFYDEITKQVFQNFYLEKAKVKYRIGENYREEYEKALKLNPEISKKGIEKILKENYRGISDRAVGEFLISTGREE
jgi:hypothetical protein